MERNLGPFRCFAHKNNTRKKLKTKPGEWCRFRSSLQSPVGEIAPVFVCRESCFSWREKLPPRIEPQFVLAGIFTGKHQQFESTLSEIGRSILDPCETGSRTWELSLWLYSVILARRMIIRRKLVVIIAKILLQMDVNFSFYIYTDYRLHRLLFPSSKIDIILHEISLLW